MSEPELETFQCFQCGLKVQADHWPKGWELFEYKVSLSAQTDDNCEVFRTGMWNNLCLCSRRCIGLFLQTGTRMMGYLKPRNLKTINPPVGPFKELMEELLKTFENSESLSLYEDED